MNIFTRSAASICYVSTGMPLMQTRSIFKPRFSLFRKSQNNNSKESLKNLTIEPLALDKLFKDNQLNQEYISEKIFAALKTKLPESITVHDETKKSKGSTSKDNSNQAPTVHTIPSTSNSNDFILYWLFFDSIINRHYPHQASLSYSDSYHKYTPTHGLEEEKKTEQDVTAVETNADVLRSGSIYSSDSINVENKSHSEENHSSQTDNASQSSNSTSCYNNTSSYDTSRANDSGSSDSGGGSSSDW